MKDYNKIVDRAWLLHDEAIEKFEARVSVLGLIPIAYTLFKVPIQWDHARWVDLLWVGVIILVGIASIGICKLIIDAYKDAKNEELTAQLLKYERWHKRGLEAINQWKEIDKLLDSLPGPIFITL